VSIYVEGAGKSRVLGHASVSEVAVSPTTLMQIVEAHVCTELSDDGVYFEQVSCESYLMN
jgi:hypothetical protein